MELSKFPHHSVYIDKLPGCMHYHLIFELSTTKNDSVYMRHSIFTEPSHDIQIVFVDAQKLLRLWQNMEYPQQPQLSYGDEEEWRKDYKFHLAEEGFSKGRINPVSLAEIECHQYIRYGKIYTKWLYLFKKHTGYKTYTETACSFINGITRTIWLLANGVIEFPVYVYNEPEAGLLSKHAGIMKNSYYGLPELNHELRMLSGLTLNVYDDL